MFIYFQTLQFNMFVNDFSFNFSIQEDKEETTKCPFLQRYQFNMGRCDKLLGYVDLMALLQSTVCFKLFDFYWREITVL